MDDKGEEVMYTGGEGSLHLSDEEEGGGPRSETPVAPAPEGEAVPPPSLEVQPPPSPSGEDEDAGGGSPGEREGGGEMGLKEDAPVPIERFESFDALIPSEGDAVAESEGADGAEEVPTLEVDLSGAGTPFAPAEEKAEVAAGPEAEAAAVAGAEEAAGPGAAEPLAEAEAGAEEAAGPEAAGPAAEAKVEAGAEEATEPEAEAGALAEAEAEPVEAEGAQSVEDISGGLGESEAEAAARKEREESEAGKRKLFEEFDELEDGEELEAGDEENLESALSASREERPLIEAAEGDVRDSVHPWRKPAETAVEKRERQARLEEAMEPLESPDGMVQSIEAQRSDVDVRKVYKAALMDMHAQLLSLQDGVKGARAESRKLALAKDEMARDFAERAALGAKQLEEVRADNKRLRALSQELGVGQKSGPKAKADRERVFAQLAEEIERKSEQLRKSQESNARLRNQCNVKAEKLAALEKLRDSLTREVATHVKIDEKIVRMEQTHRRSLMRARKLLEEMGKRESEAVAEAQAAKKSQRMALSTYKGEVEQLKAALRSSQRNEIEARARFTSAERTLAELDKEVQHLRAVCSDQGRKLSEHEHNSMVRAVNMIKRRQERVKAESARKFAGAADGMTAELPAAPPSITVPDNRPRSAAPSSSSSRAEAQRSALSQLRYEGATKSSAMPPPSQRRLESQLRYEEDTPTRLLAPSLTLEGDGGVGESDSPIGGPSPPSAAPPPSETMSENQVERPQLVDEGAERSLSPPLDGKHVQEQGSPHTVSVNKLRSLEQRCMNDLAKLNADPASDSQAVEKAQRKLALIQRKIKEANGSGNATIVSLNRSTSHPPSRSATLYASQPSFNGREEQLAESKGSAGPLRMIGHVKASAVHSRTSSGRSVRSEESEPELLLG